MLFKLQTHSYRLESMATSRLKTVPLPLFTTSYEIMGAVKFRYLHKEEKPDFETTHHHAAAKDSNLKKL